MSAIETARAEIEKILSKEQPLIKRIPNPFRH